jgi:Ca2+-binding RTX toxin-like protein
MLAILGMFGFAIAAVMMTGDETEVDDTASDTLSESSDPLETLSLDSFLSPDDVVFDGSDADDRVLGNAHDNDLTGNGGDDQIDGGAGNDSLHGGAGEDLLYGDDGLDDLFGHIGDDMLYGGADTDKLNGGGGDDALYGGDGNDSLLGSLGDDALYGGDGADVLNGGSGNDVIDGGDDTEKDYLNGSDGDDFLHGGRDDNLNGGAGADTFAIDQDAGAHVDDFDPSEDIIEVVYDTGDEQPTLSLVRDDGTTSLLADGALVAQFAGAPDIDLSAVRMIAA